MWLSWTMHSSSKCNIIFLEAKQRLMQDEFSLGSSTTIQQREFNQRAILTLSAWAKEFCLLSFCYQCCKRFWGERKINVINTHARKQASLSVLSYLWFVYSSLVLSSDFIYIHSGILCFDIARAAALSYRNERNLHSYIVARIWQHAKTNFVKSFCALSLPVNIQPSDWFDIKHFFSAFSAFL